MPYAQHITVKPLPGISPERAGGIRARAWSFVFECWRKKQEGGPATAPDSAKGGLSDSSAKTIIRERP